MSGASKLRRELGSLETHAALIGILVGAGIFRVTSDAWALTGPSVILGYVVLAVVVLASSVPYMVFLSTRLGEFPGGEYTHISRVLGTARLAFLGAWLKIVSYLGALAYLASALADYVAPLVPGGLGPASHRAVAAGALVFFWLVHVVGVRWFARVQVAMFAVLGLSLVVLIVPGLPAIAPRNYVPFWTGGTFGFMAALPPLFFAYAGFESIAHAAGEVKDSRARLPRVFFRGILITTVLFVLMSVVTFGVLPGSRLAGSTAAMSDVAAVYLPDVGAAFVTLGAILAITTSLNATMLVPSRLCVMFADDGVVPRWLGHVDPRTGTPIIGLVATLMLALALLYSGQVGLALDTAVLALVGLYLLHSVAALLLPTRRPDLQREVSAPISIRLQRRAALVSIVAMATLIAVQVVQDLGTLVDTSLLARMGEARLTSLELTLLWALIGLAIHRRRT